MLFSCRKYADTISSAYGLGDNCIHFLTRAFQRPVYRDEYEVFPGLLLLLSQSREALGTIFSGTFARPLLFSPHFQSADQNRPYSIVRG